MSTTRNGHQLRDIIEQIEAFRFCGPSDDPDEQTAVLYGFRHLVKAFRRAGRSIPDAALQKEIQQLIDPETLYEAYDVHSDIAAMLDDLKVHLDSPWSSEPHMPATVLKAFISYSTSDKNIAGQVKTVLDNHGIDSFLAHEDVSVSQEWKSRIVQELQICSIVVPLLSAEFKQSEWASQEIGLAFARPNVLFIPLSVDGTVPFGLISDIQGKPIATKGIESGLLIAPIIAHFPHEIIPALIDKLSNARSYRRAEALMLPLVPHFDKFYDDEINAFAATSIENRQIWEATDCRTKYLPKFLSLHQSRMDPDKREALKYQVENGKRCPSREDA